MFLGAIVRDVLGIRSQENPPPAILPSPARPACVVLVSPHNSGPWGVISADTTGLERRKEVVDVSCQQLSAAIANATARFSGG